MTCLIGVWRHAAGVQHVVGGLFQLLKAATTGMYNLVNISLFIYLYLAVVYMHIISVYFVH